MMERLDEKRENSHSDDADLDPKLEVTPSYSRRVILLPHRFRQTPSTESRIHRMDLDNHPPSMNINNTQILTSDHCSTQKPNVKSQRKVGNLRRFTKSALQMRSFLYIMEGSRNSSTAGPSNAGFIVDKTRTQLRIQNTAKSPLDSPLSKAQKSRDGSISKFKFDHIFTHNDSLDKFSQFVLDDVLDRVVEGSDDCIISVGDSIYANSITLFGSDKHTVANGLISCAISCLFRLISEQKEHTGAKFSVRISALAVEGQSETVTDLLHHTPKIESPCKNSDNTGGPNIDSNHRNEVRAPSAEKAILYANQSLNAFNILKKNQSVQTTVSNVLFFFFTIHVYQYRVERCGQGSGVAGGRSRLHFIDLVNNSPIPDMNKEARNAQLHSAESTFPDVAHILHTIVTRRSESYFSGSQLILLLRNAIESCHYQPCLIVEASLLTEKINEELEYMRMVKSLRRYRDQCHASMTSGSIQSKICDDNSSCHSFGLRRAHRSRRSARLRRNSRNPRLSVDGMNISTQPNLNMSEEDDISSSEYSCDTVIFLGHHGQSYSVRAKKNLIKNMDHSLIEVNSDTGSSELHHKQVCHPSANFTSREVGSKFPTSRSHRTVSGRRSIHAWSRSAVKNAIETLSTQKEQWVDGPKASFSPKKSTSTDVVFNRIRSNEMPEIKSFMMDKNAEFCQIEHLKEKGPKATLNDRCRFQSLISGYSMENRLTNMNLGMHFEKLPDGKDTDGTSNHITPQKSLDTNVMDRKSKRRGATDSPVSKTSGHEQLRSLRHHNSTECKVSRELNQCNVKPFVNDWVEKHNWLLRYGCTGINTKKMPQGTKPTNSHIFTRSIDKLPCLEQINGEEGITYHESDKEGHFLFYDINNGPDNTQHGENQLNAYSKTDQDHSKSNYARIADWLNSVSVKVCESHQGHLQTSCSTNPINSPFLSPINHVEVSNKHFQSISPVHMCELCRTSFDIPVTSYPIYTQCIINQDLQTWSPIIYSSRRSTYTGQTPTRRGQSVPPKQINKHKPNESMYHTTGNDILIKDKDDLIHSFRRPDGSSNPHLHREQQFTTNATNHQCQHGEILASIDCQCFQMDNIYPSQNIITNVHSQSLFVNTRSKKSRKQRPHSYCSTDSSMRMKLKQDEANDNNFQSSNDVESNIQSIKQVQNVSKESKPKSKFLFGFLTSPLFCKRKQPAHRKSPCISETLVETFNHSSPRMANLQSLTSIHENNQRLLTNTCHIDDKSTENVTRIGCLRREIFTSKRPEVMGTQTSPSVQTPVQIFKADCPSRPDQPSVQSSSGHGSDYSSYIAYDLRRDYLDLSAPQSQDFSPYRNHPCRRAYQRLKVIDPLLFDKLCVDVSQQKDRLLIGQNNVGEEFHEILYDPHFSNKAMIMNSFNPMRRYRTMLNNPRTGGHTSSGYESIVRDSEASSHADSTSAGSSASGNKLSTDADRRSTKTQNQTMTDGLMLERSNTSDYQPNDTAQTTSSEINHDCGVRAENSLPGIRYALHFKHDGMNKEESTSRQHMDAGAAIHKTMALSHSLSASSSSGKSRRSRSEPPCSGETSEATTSSPLSVRYIPPRSNTTAISSLTNSIETGECTKQDGCDSTNEVETDQQNIIREICESIRLERIHHLLLRQDTLKMELVNAKEQLMVHPSSWTFDLFVADQMNPQNIGYLEALEKETEILQKRVDACKSHLMFVTCFDVKAHPSRSRSVSTTGESNS